MPRPPIEDQALVYTCLVIHLCTLRRRCRRRRCWLARCCPPATPTPTTRPAPTAACWCVGAGGLARVPLAALHLVHLSPRVLFPGPIHALLHSACLRLFDALCFLRLFERILVRLHVLLESASLSASNSATHKTSLLDLFVLLLDALHALREFLFRGLLLHPPVSPMRVNHDTTTPTR